MPAQRIGCSLYTRQRSLRAAQLEQRFEDVELPHNGLPLFLGNRDQIRSLGCTCTRAVARLCFPDWNTFEPAFTVFLHDDCVHTIAVDDNEAPFAPSNYGSWNEANRGGHRDSPGRV